MKYLVSHQSQSVGPFTVDEILTKVRAKELELFDYIFDAQKEDWVLMLEFAPLSEQLKSAKPARPPGAPPKVEAGPTTASSPHAISEWFVLKGDQRFGPFAYPDVIKMLQQKALFPYDFIWHAGLNEWTRVAEVAELSSKSVRQLFETKLDVFATRKHKRMPFSGAALVHDGVKLWRGTGFEISRGGVGLTMTNALVQPGQQLQVHFSATGEWPAFNVLGEVVAKKFVGDDTPVEYGLKFVRFSADGEAELFKKVN